MFFLAVMAFEKVNHPASLKGRNEPIEIKGAQGNLGAQSHGSDDFIKDSRVAKKSDIMLGSRRFIL